MDRPKQGFGVPLAKWLRGELYNQLMRYADKQILRKQDIFEAEKVHELIDIMLKVDSSQYSAIVWGFFVFQMWYQEHVGDLW